VGDVLKGSAEVVPHPATGSGLDSPAKYQQYISKSFFFEHKKSTF
jgi:hypothetical protein